LGRYEESIQAYEKAIEINPNSAAAWYNKGFSLDKLGRHDEASVCYNKAENLKSK